jgi:cell division protein FtsI/penicillin-binding protein 2
VCEPGGTAHPRDGMDLRKYKVAGKSGTPQSVEGGKMVDHAWFAGYFPHDHPRLVFAILQQNSETGGASTCAPILYDLLTQPEIEAYLQ